MPGRVDGMLALVPGIGTGRGVHAAIGDERN